ncbi:MAG TPA: M14 metallopeptidase family protein, partial [Longimicrobiales bacterium]|nr:M14 metallopeptidase family protein [Longimicrobiales bacterium]
HHMRMRYVDRLAATSRRVHVDTVARTHEGREVLSVVVTSEANQSRIAQIKADAQRVADPRGASASDLNAVVGRLPSIVWLGYTVHGGEASGAEAALAFMYQLAAGTDPQTKLILDSTVVVIDPLQNPDGHERHVQDVNRSRGVFGPTASPASLIHSGNWPGPRTNHYYFDMNRDYYVMSQPETRGRIKVFRTWFPHVDADLHEMGSNSTYFFPPSMDPINKIIPKNIQDWWSTYAAANGAAFDEHGWGYFRREGYDQFYPGYGDSWPLFNGAVGMTYEEASSAGGAIRRTDGTVLTLKDAAHRHYTTSFATALTTARNRTQRVKDFLAFKQNAINEPVRAGVRGIAFERDRQGRADSLAQRLLDNGIEVLRLRSSASPADAQPFATSGPARLSAGSYVVDFSQPSGALARSILEPDAPLDSTFVHEEESNREIGVSERFYDLTAWSMPYTFRVKAWTLRTIPAGAERIASVPVAPAPALPNARVAYAFEPGSEASIRMLAGLLADSVRVNFAQKWFKAGDEAFQHGAFVVRVAANNDRVHDIVRRHAAASGAHVVSLSSGLVTEGTDLGSSSVIPLRTPRVALVGGAGVSGNSFGATWYAFDQRMHFPVTNIPLSALGSSAIDEFNVIVLPSASLEQSTADRVGTWVRNGGVLVTMDGSTQWLSGEKVGISRLRARRDTTRADNQPGAPLPADIPGAIMRVVADTLSPLTAGVDEREFTALVFSDRIYKTPKDFRPGEVVLKFAGEKSVRVAGYVWPEVPARIADSPYLWTERVGRGRVIAFAGDPNFRDMWRGMYPLFANAVLIGGSF